MAWGPTLWLVGKKHIRIFAGASVKKKLDFFTPKFGHMAYVEKNDLLSKEKHICFGQITIIPKPELRGIWVPCNHHHLGRPTSGLVCILCKKICMSIYIYVYTRFTCISIYIVMTCFKSWVTSLLLQLNLFQVNNHLQKKRHDVVESPHLVLLKLQTDHFLTSCKGRTETLHPKRKT